MEMIKCSNKNQAVKKCDKMEGTSVIRFEKAYQVCDTDAIPEGAKVIYPTAGESVQPEGKDIRAKAQVAPTEKKEITPIKEEVPIGVDKPMSTGAHVSKLGTSELKDLEPVDEEELDIEEEKEFVVDRNATGIEMTEEEVEAEMKIEEAPDPETYVAPKVDTRKKKIVIRQSEPRGAVTVSTIDLRTSPRLEMVREIEGSEPCIRVIPTGGACHAYPKTDEDWAELMENTIASVRKFYSEDEYDIVVDRIK